MNAASARMKVADDRPLLSVKGLKKHFAMSKPLLNRLIEGGETQTVKAVDGLDLEIPRGQTLSLVGESGCGKSTVARLIMGLSTPSAGSIRFDGADISQAPAGQPAAVRRRMQMIFQDPYASLNPRWRVRDIIAEPLRTYGLSVSREEERREVDRLLEFVGLNSKDGDKFPHEFSGGQRQRISIARAISTKPEFLVCDEPTSALDVSVQAQILNLMRDMQRELGLTYLFISHDLAVVNFMSDWIGVMYLGRLVEVSPAAQLFGNPQHPYTRLLLDTIPDLGMSKRDRVPASGEVPNPINPPSGCHFHPRCALANDRCRRETPNLRAHGNGVRVSCHAVEEGRGDLPAVASAGNDHAAQAVI
ncbi:ATP-binding cassette domain-containing protein [Sinorhizobium sp. 8-89]|uniref:ABC transporter ATP-binding protein n=1 Tax=Sinorhizobium sp. 7-81 TaxID=3049087 RepID=UPI0024C36560|nr:oligopeptide/dipeptide ABC transporter ATP-binding protein [Sinorhizobium sp. 7-81]MDK1389223.1 ATP-binding cassette domain-containing protein [Sinorhizobium sp. 7-81]